MTAPRDYLAQQIERCLLIRQELALPLAAARAGLETLTVETQGRDHNALAALEAIAEMEHILLGVVGLCFEVAPEFPRERLDLEPLIAYTIDFFADAGADDSRVQAQIEGPLTGFWNAWACRRMVHELVAFALAMTDAPIALGAGRDGQAAFLRVHATGVTPASLEGETLLHELGSSPRQFHLWLASRLAEAHGGRLEIGTDGNGWVCLTATLPDQPRERAAL